MDLPVLIIRRTLLGHVLYLLDLESLSPTLVLTTLELQFVRHISKTNLPDQLELRSHQANLQSPARMCVTFRFYHLCGHIHKVTTFPCTYTPTTALTPPPLPEEDVVAPSSDPCSAYRPFTCLSDPADAAEEIRLFPTLCASCARTGIISEWLDRAPDGRRADVIRAWNKTHHHRPSSEVQVSEQAMPESEVAASQPGNLDTTNNSGSSPSSNATPNAVDVDADDDTVITAGASIPSPQPPSPSTTMVPDECVPSWMRQSVEHRDRDQDRDPDGTTTKRTGVDIPALRKRMAAVAARIRRLKQRHKIAKGEGLQGQWQGQGLVMEEEKEEEEEY